ncbi:hypothetical protein J4573_25075 [Actinomadura barringtoniae]|uniref:Uncharacterized protein n=1 Tax=Actinomadura barringtoniae TaxID=1427535 RepID=A0A939T654_9ACTN|nr:hypothetical protein [Actinomadura barringtoniae]MBO2450399.1 hypothetical protein [Actinomadura barringtoniae]
MAPDSEPPPAFDEDFVKSASFTEPSADDRAKPLKPPKRPRGPGPLARWRSRRPRAARSGAGLDGDRARAKTLLIIGALVLVAVLLAVVIGPSWQLQFKLP